MTRGVPQGSVLSPFIFNLVMEVVAACWRETGIPTRFRQDNGQTATVSVGGLCFADDAIILHTDLAILRATWERVVATCRALGLTVAVHKCEATALCPPHWNPWRRAARRRALKFQFQLDTPDGVETVPVVDRVTNLGTPDSFGRVAQGRRAEQDASEAGRAALDLGAAAPLHLAAPGADVHVSRRPPLHAVPD